MGSFAAGKMTACTPVPKLKRYRRYSTHASTRPDEANRSTNTVPLNRPSASSQDRLHAQSVWDNLMEDVSLSDVAPLPVRRPVPVSSVGPMGRPTVRRQAMTREESNVFTDLFDQIFAAQRGFLRSSSKNKDPLSGVGIGRRPGDSEPPTVHTLYGKLKRRSKRHHDTTDLENLVEKLRAEIEVIETDIGLLTWAVQNIFSTTGLLPDTSKKSRTNKSESVTTTAFPDDDSPSTSSPVISDIDEPTRISTYPHLLSTLIATFRDKFHDPHLALSIFAYARRLSVPSYVFGCTTTAYNELINTFWTCFKDVHGVVEALQEMKNNGVFPDSHTRNLAMRIRNEATRTELTTSDTGSDQPTITVSNPMLLVYLDRMDELIRPEEKSVEPVTTRAKNGGAKIVEVRIPSHQEGPRPRPKLYQMTDPDDRLELV